MTGSCACWKGQLFPFTHPEGIVYGTHCFLILPGSLLSARVAGLPPPGFAEGGFVRAAGACFGEAPCLG